MVSKWLCKLRPVAQQGTDEKQCLPGLQDEGHLSGIGKKSMIERKQCMPAAK